MPDRSKMKIFATHAATAAVLIRLMVGAVFVSEGVQKFLYRCWLA